MEVLCQAHGMVVFQCSLSLKVVHRVSTVTEGSRYSVTLLMPGKLDQLTLQNGDDLGRLGFPVQMYDRTLIESPFPLVSAVQRPDPRESQSD